MILRARALLTMSGLQTLKILTVDGLLLGGGDSSLIHTHCSVSRVLISAPFPKATERYHMSGLWRVDGPLLRIGVPLLTGNASLSLACGMSSLQLLACKAFFLVYSSRVRLSKVSGKRDIV